MKKIIFLCIFISITFDAFSISNHGLPTLQASTKNPIDFHLINDTRTTFNSKLSKALEYDKLIELDDKTKTNKLKNQVYNKYYSMDAEGNVSLPKNCGDLIMNDLGIDIVGLIILACEDMEIGINRLDKFLVFTKNSFLNVVVRIVTKIVDAAIETIDWKENVDNLTADLLKYYACLKFEAGMGDLLFKTEKEKDEYLEKLDNYKNLFQKAIAIKGREIINENWKKFADPQFIPEFSEQNNKIIDYLKKNKDNYVVYDMSSRQNIIDGYSTITAEQVCFYNSLERLLRGDNLNSLKYNVYDNKERHLSDYSALGLNSFLYNKIGSALKTKLKKSLDEIEEKEKQLSDALKLLREKIQKTEGNDDIAKKIIEETRKKITKCQEYFKGVIIKLHDEHKKELKQKIKEEDLTLYDRFIYKLYINDLASLSTLFAKNKATESGLASIFAIMFGIKIFLSVEEGGGYFESYGNTLYGPIAVMRYKGGHFTALVPDFKKLEEK